MPIMQNKKRWLIVMSCLLLASCTKETIIREIPASSSSDAATPDNGVAQEDIASGESQNDTDNGESQQDSDNVESLEDHDNGSNMVTGDTDSGDWVPGNMVTGDTDTDTDTDTDADADADTETDTVIEADTDTGSDNGTDGDIDADLQEDPITEDTTNNETPTLLPLDVDAVDGAPGQTVDCQETLPCRWISGDSQYYITVTNADNIATRERLQLSYSLESLHDTDTSVTSGGRALDAGGRELAPAEQTLGSGSAGISQSLLAGDSLPGDVTFDRGSSTDVLAEWDISVMDNSVVRLASFANIPVGTITSSYADCEYVLPCVWLSPRNDVSITLTSAGGFTTDNRLSADFTIMTSSSTTVILDEGASALSTDGLMFEGRTHSLGNTSGYKLISTTSRAASSLTGTINFYRTNEIPTALSELLLVLYEDNPVPRWNPKFVNVPVQ